ncbi:DUF7550 family protein [Halocatena halophila]|uniref:DUF7550 family protein n=1 Tax=Halocatena halophila TaxID=2814576 RepID=UPI002ED28337
MVEHDDADYELVRQTAPQDEYTMRNVTVGTIIAIVGMAVVFGIPLAAIGL